MEMEEEGEEFAIHKITKKRIHRGEVQYLVQWEGLPDSQEGTWEPKSGLTNAMEAIYEYERTLLEKETRRRRARPSATALPKPVQDIPRVVAPRIRRSFERGSMRFGKESQSAHDKMDEEPGPSSKKIAKKPAASFEPIESTYGTRRAHKSKNSRHVTSPASTSTGSPSSDSAAASAVHPPSESDSTSSSSSGH